MKHFRAADKSHAGGDEKHDINFHWPYIDLLILQNSKSLIVDRKMCRKFNLPTLTMSNSIYLSRHKFTKVTLLLRENYSEDNREFV
jgi:hypothetical protein